MLIVILFAFELIQKLTLRDKLTLKQNKRMNFGIMTLGIMSLLTVTFNIVLHRGWWNGDFFSPFLTGFSK